jgi:lipopolysaccharide biosynthesis glycosyltransferase
MIDIVVGFDQREAVAYHTFCQSVISNTSLPVRFTPLVGHGIDGQRNGSNQFVYSRFLTPHLMDYKGWAIFADGDMVCNKDIAELWEMRDDRYAVMVVKHFYQTKYKKKYLNNINEDYPRKNWSSLILWNCAHKANRSLTPKSVPGLSGPFLHRFSWLTDAEIGDLPISWNWLAMEYPENDNASLVHYTIGTPCFKDYADSSMSEYWWRYYGEAQEGRHEDRLLGLGQL